MYESAEPELQRILKLVEGCPETLRPKAFEILLQGYVTSLSAPARPPAPSLAPATPHVHKADNEWAASIPAEALRRLQVIAKQVKTTSAEHLSSLFDFSQDPFGFGPFAVPDGSKKERTRRVAQLVAARSYLATGHWLADWAEIKSMCTTQNCYDLANFAATLKAGKGDIFQSVKNGESVELNAKGISAAHQLMATLVSDAA